ncbi:MAG: glycosyl transferase, partial [Bacteroidales bacterium]
MKIGILGTRGIPNHYGGFEQFAEYLSVGLLELGAEVWVYNSHNHPYQEKVWKNVNLIHCFDPEYKIGLAGQFLYDFNCILDSRNRNFDILLQLGYTTN